VSAGNFTIENEMAIIKKPLLDPRSSALIRGKAFAFAVGLVLASGQKLAARSLPIRDH
jgi:hypothetical protein